MESFNTIGLIGRLGSDKVVETLKRLVIFLERHGLDIVIEDRTAAVDRRNPDSHP